MKYVRWTISYALYWMGHAVSRLDRWDIGWLIDIWYPVYNRLMGWSTRVQGAGDFGPWQDVPDGEA